MSNKTELKTYPDKSHGARAGHPPALPTVSAKFFRKANITQDTRVQYVFFGTNLRLAPRQLSMGDFGDDLMNTYVNAPTDQPNQMTGKIMKNNNDTSNQANPVTPQEAEPNKESATRASAQEDPATPQKPDESDAEEDTEIVEPTSGSTAKAVSKLTEGKLLSLKSIRLAGGLTEEQFKWLTDEAKHFVEEHEEASAKTPRQFKRENWREFTQDFMDSLGAVPHIFRSAREGCNPARDPVWPDDKSSIKLLVFALLKLHAKNHHSKAGKKRSADGGDEESSTPNSSKAKKQTAKATPQSSTRQASEQGTPTKKAASTTTGKTPGGKATTPKNSSTADAKVKSADKDNKDKKVEEATNGEKLQQTTATHENSASKDTIQPTDAEAQPKALDVFQQNMAQAGAKTHSAPPIYPLPYHTPLIYSFEIYIKEHKSESSKMVSIQLFTTFTEFYGLVMLSTEAENDRAEIAKARSCWIAIPGEAHENFDINVMTTEMAWTNIMRRVAGTVGKGCKYEGQHLAASFVKNAAEDPMTAAIVQGP